LTLEFLLFLAAVVYWRGVFQSIWWVEPRGHGREQRRVRAEQDRVGRKVKEQAREPEREQKGVEEEPRKGEGNGREQKGTEEKHEK
jgi:hypothetical protein